MPSQADAARPRRSFTPWHLFLSLLLLAAWPILVGAAPSPTEYEIKAAFLYKFCLYVEWPDDAFASDTSPVTLGIAGPPHLLRLLETVVRGQSIQGRPIAVRRVEQETQANGLHLLFIAQSEKERLARLIAATQGQPTLLVTETAGGLDAGSAINLVVVDGRVRFDVELSASNTRGLWLSAQLLRVAHTVRKAAP